MKAIQVKYMPATNTRGARVKAMAEGVPSITVAYDYSGHELAFREVARDMARKYHWRGAYACGWLADGSAVYVNAHAHEFIVDAPMFEVTA
jgi:hypothetical protein